MTLWDREDELNEALRLNGAPPETPRPYRGPLT
jgi:hypothetical protein